jgi:hypothetical protein
VSNLPGDARAGGDTDMTGTYVKVLLVEAAILIALFVFGRLFS